jgi:hypothetical protein
MVSIMDAYVNKMIWISGYEYYLDTTDLIPPHIHVETIVILLDLADIAAVPSVFFLCPHGDTVC